MIFGGPEAVKRYYANLREMLDREAKDRRIEELEGFIDAYCGQPDQTKVFDEFKAIRDRNNQLEVTIASISALIKQLT